MADTVESNQTQSPEPTAPAAAQPADTGPAKRAPQTVLHDFLSTVVDMSGNHPKLTKLLDELVDIGFFLAPKL
jgi:hypothetical protein